LNICFRNSPNIQRFVDFFYKRIKPGHHCQNLEREYQQEQDLPVFIIYETNFETAIKCALSNYINDIVFVLGQFWDTYYEKIQKIGWNILTWEDYLQCGNNVDPSTLVMSVHPGQVAGIETKNVISLISTHEISYSKTEENSGPKRYSNSDAHIMLRAVAHLTVVLEVSKEIGNAEEEKEFFDELKDYAKVIDLRTAENLSE